MHEAGIISEWQLNNTRKIVIVMDARDTYPVVYLEAGMDTDFLKVIIPELHGVEVIVNANGRREGSSGSSPGKADTGSGSEGERRAEGEDKKDQ